jgi:glycosyltransferase involved in cell wall biosynthesis
MDADMIYQQSLYMRWSLRLASRFAAEVTACSVWAAQACAQYAPTFTAATTIPNGVDPDQWDVGPLPLLPVLCAWGRHVHQKGFDLAIRAFALLKARAPAARLLVGGAGVETPRLRRIAGAGVEFVGPLDRAGVKALLSMSRVAVVPSRIEPFGIAAVEALAAGRGLVYASNTGLEEATGGVGRGVDVSDPTNLALAMEAELAQPTAAALGRARAGELSWTRVCDAYVGLYRHIETGA